MLTRHSNTIGRSPRLHRRGYWRWLMGLHLHGEFDGTHAVDIVIIRVVCLLQHSGGVLLIWDFLFGLNGVAYCSCSSLSQTLLRVIVLDKNAIKVASMRCLEMLPEVKKKKKKSSLKRAFRIGRTQPHYPAISSRSSGAFLLERHII